MPCQPLVVFVPDSTGRGSSVQALVNFPKSEEAFREAHFLVCEFPMSWVSNQDLSQVSGGIAADIDAFYTKNAPAISRIILCGYSLGAMLVRRAFLDASGLGYPAGQRRPWASAVERIVLVGAICRGFHFSRLPLLHRVGLWMAGRLGRAKALRSAFVGEPWASNVRLDWITYWDHEARPRVVNIRRSGRRPPLRGGRHRRREGSVGRVPRGKRSQPRQRG